MVEDHCEKLCDACAKHASPGPIKSEEPESPRHPVGGQSSGTLVNLGSVYGPYSEFNPHTALYVNDRLKTIVKEGPSREIGEKQALPEGDMGGLMVAMCGIDIDISPHAPGRATPRSRGTNSGVYVTTFADELTASPEDLNFDRCESNQRAVTVAEDWTIIEKVKRELDEDEWSLLTQRG
jgi:hypothetical protein